MCPLFIILPHNLCQLPFSPSPPIEYAATNANHHASGDASVIAPVCLQQSWPCLVDLVHQLKLPPPHLYKILPTRISGTGLHWCSETLGRSIIFALVLASIIRRFCTQLVDVPIWVGAKCDNNSATSNNMSTRPISTAHRRSIPQFLVYLSVLPICLVRGLHLRLGG